MLGGGLVQGFSAASHAEHVRSGAGEGESGGAADPGSGSGHDRDMVLQGAAGVDGHATLLCSMFVNSMYGLLLGMPQVVQGASEPLYIGNPGIADYAE